MSKPVEPEHTSSFEYNYLHEKYQSALEELKQAKFALAIISDWGIDPTSTAIAASASKALDRIDKFLKENG